MRYLNVAIILIISLSLIIPLTSATEEEGFVGWLWNGITDLWENWFGGEVIATSENSPVGMGLVTIQTTGQAWTLIEDTESDLFYFSFDKNQQKSKHCVLSYTATSKKDLENLTFSTADDLLSNTDPKEKIKAEKVSDSDLDKDYYGYCFEVKNNEKKLKFGTNSITTEYQDQNLINYQLDFADVNVSLTCEGVNQNDIWITQNPDNYKFGANGSFEGLKNCTYTIESSVEIYDSGWSPYIVDPEPAECGADNCTENHKFDFADVCSKKYEPYNVTASDEFGSWNITKYQEIANCEFEFSDGNKKLVVNFLSDNDIDPKIEYESENLYLDRKITKPYVESIDNGNGKHTATIYSYPKYKQENGNWTETDETIIQKNGGYFASGSVYNLNVLESGEIILEHNGNNLSLGLLEVTSNSKILTSNLSNWIINNSQIENGTLIWEHPLGLASYEIHYGVDTFWDKFVLSDSLKTFIENNADGNEFGIGLNFGDSGYDISDFNTQNEITITGSGSTAKLRPSFINHNDYSGNGTQETWDLNSGKLTQTIPLSDIDKVDELHTVVQFFENASYSGGNDTFINRRYPTTNYDTSSDGAMGTDWQSTYICRRFLRWDLSSIGAVGSVQNANISLVTTYDGGMPWNFTTARVLREWQDSSATWNIYSTGNSWTTAGGDSVGNDRTAWSTQLTQVESPTYTTFYFFNVTEWVEDWLVDGDDNYGLMFAASPEGVTGHWVRTRTIADSVEVRRPRLTIEYSATVPDDEYPVFSNYWDDNASLIDSGTGHFNVTLLSTNGTVWLEINGTNITATNSSASPTLFNTTHAFTHNATYPYLWHSWGNGTATNYNVSSARDYTVNASGDDEYPVFTAFTETPADPATYSATAIYEFNTTLLSTNGTVWIRFNSDNYTATNVTGGATIFNWTTTGLSAGNYSYNWSAYGNGTANNFNMSDTYSYNISKAVPEGNLTNSTALTRVWDGTLMTVGLEEGQSGDGDVTYIIYKDDVSVGTSDTEGSVGVYNYILNTTGGRNWTANISMDNFTLTITQATSILNGTINHTQSNLTATNGTGNMNIYLNATLMGSCVGVGNITVNGTLWNHGTLPIYNVTNLSAGFYNITFRYEGNTNCTADTEVWWVNLTAIVDSTNPNTTINTPLNQSYTTTTIVFNFTALDETEMSTCLYTLTDGTTNYTMTNSSTSPADWNATNTTMSQGSHTVTAYCNDTSNNLNMTENITFFIDSLNPDITILSPANATYNTPLNYTINATDTNGIAECWYSINAGVSNESMVNLIGDIYNFSAGAVYSDNGYIAEFWCNDTYGNINNTMNISFAVDTIPLEMTIIYPANTSYTINVSNLNYTWSNGGASVDSCLYTRNGGATNSTYVAGGTNFTEIISAEGSNNWTVWCNDSLNRWNLTSVTFFKDSILPIINITFPINNTNSSDSGLVVNYTRSDTNLASCWYSNDTMTGNTTLVSCANITGVTWVEGNHNVTIWANDTLNNQNSSSVTFTIDTTAPTFEDIYNVTKLQSQSVNEDFNASDSGVGFDCWAVNNTGNFSVDCTGQLTNITAITTGIHYINLTINDSLNNLNSMVINVTYSDIADVIPPYFTAIPNNVTHSYLTVLGVDYNATDETAFDSYAVNDTRFAINSSGWLRNDSVISVGYYLLNITINDSSNNLNSTLFEYNVNADISYPLFTNLTDNNDSFQNSGNATFNVTVSNTNGTVILTFNNTNYTASASTPVISWCYQEFTNVSTSCGGLDTGYYGSDSIWNETYPVSYTYDGDWGTFGRTNYPSSGGWMFANYSIPYDALNSSVLQIGWSKETIQNLTIEDCMDNGDGILQIRVLSSTQGVDTASRSAWYCWNNLGAGYWYTMKGFENGIFNHQILEEAMVWNISKTTYNVTVPITEGGVWNYHWNAYGDGASHNYNRTLDDSYTVNITDLVYPQFSDYWDNNGSLVEEGWATFNVTVSNTNGTVWLNFQGEADVYATNLTADVYNASVYVSDTSDHQYYWSAYGNGTANNLNNSIIRHYSTNVSRVPEVNITYPINNANYNTLILDLNYTVTDDMDLDKCWWNNGTDNSTAVVAGINWTALQATEGTTTWTVWCNDTSGNLNYSTITFKPSGNTVPPDVIINSPLTQTYNTSTISFNVTATDVSPGVDSCWFTWNNGDINYTMTNSSSNPAEYNLTNTTMADGDYKVIFYCNDTIRNNVNGSESVEFTVDTTQPYFTTIPNNVTHAYLIVLGVDYDAGDGEGFDTYAVNDTRFDINDSGWLRNDTTIGVGTYILNITINDTVNFVNSTLFNYTVTQLASVVNLTLNDTQGNYSIVEGDTIDLNCSTLTGDASAILTLYNESVLINSGVSPIGNTTTFSTAGLFNVTCYYSDTQNYSTSFEEWWVNVTSAVVDSTPPYFDELPENQTYTYGEEISYDMNASDETSFDCFAVNDTDFTIDCTGLLTNGSSLGVGLTWINITINDSSNNLNSTVIYINITQATGLIYGYVNHLRNNYAAYNDSGQNKSNIWLNATLESGQGNINLTLNGTQINYGASPLSNLTNLTIGYYNLTAWYSGNENYTADTETWWITITGTTPVIPLPIKGCTTLWVLYDNPNIPAIRRLRCVN